MLKISLFLAALSFSTVAFAKTYTPEVEALMIEAIVAKCDLAGDEDFELDYVDIQEKVVDQGIRDYVYNAVFDVSYLGVDEHTVVRKEVKVGLKKYQVGNPDINPWEVLYVTSTDKRLCK